MDSKIKALKLIENHKKTLLLKSNYDNEVFNQIFNKKAIEHSLITVNEILKSVPSRRYWDTYNDEIPSAITFWREVKDELELLNNTLTTN